MRQRLRLGEAALWVLCGGFLAQLVGGIVADALRSLLAARSASTGASAAATAAQLDHAAIVVIPALVCSSAALLAVTLFAPQIAGAEPRAVLGLRRAPIAMYPLAALGTLALGPLGDALMRLVAERFPDATLGVVPMLNELVATTPLYVVWPAFALLPALSEELAFRGLLQHAAGRGALAIAISGVGFALFHVDPHHIAGVLPLGIFLAWVGTRSSTYVTAFAHMVNNTTAIALVRLDGLGVGYDDQQPVPIEWLVASSIVVVACILGLVRIRPYESFDTPRAAV